MFLKELHIYQFKNIQELSLFFDNFLNFFCGSNGSGKTTILDAIHYLSFTKSFINSADTENISYNKDFFKVTGKFLKNNFTEEYTCLVNRNGKKHFKYFQKDYTRLYEHIGKVPLIIISPYDHLFIIEGSEMRRKLIDSIISQFNEKYLLSLIEYNKVLKQRNSLLKTEQDKNLIIELIEIYDEKLISNGNFIYEVRKKFTDKLSEEFIKFYNLLSNNQQEIATITYKSQLNDSDFKTLLKNNLEKDFQTQYTNYGIHKDDLLFNLNNNPIKYFASQGQQKSFITSVKLSFINLFIENGLKPIILLDDIFDKLDDNRVHNMLKIIYNSKCQSFITHTDKQKVVELLNYEKCNYSLFEISNGLSINHLSV